MSKKLISNKKAIKILETTLDRLEDKSISKDHALDVAVRVLTTSKKFNKLMKK